MAGSDSIKFEICDCDVTNKDTFTVSAMQACLSQGIDNVDFLIAHPPYIEVVKFTDDDRDLSRITDLGVFLDKMILALRNGLSFLHKDRYFAIVAGDVYKNSEVVPLAFYIMDAIKKIFDVRLKGIVVKNIAGNKGKLGVQDIWKYRAMQSDYFLFKHEYIFVFKKLF